MIAEKPSWVKHGGTQIFSVDIQPGGLRFATGGGDQKVRIWNMKCVSRELQAGDSAANLLATLRDHFGSVNCVRWAKHGRYIASGSDDQVILIHERKPGSGTTEFGSGEPPDVENWKVSLTLRGHTADVVDLNWSPDDSTLASASLDNTVHIWDTSNGICTAVLRGHSSLVKGVAWDPINSFIASQSDDKTVIIWRTSDWSLAHRTDGHWAKSLGSTFFRRLDWSPCGHFITTTHGFQKPRHSAPVLERGEWSATFDFLGHNAPIIVAKFNHSMFRKNSSIPYDSKASSAGWSNGSSKAEGKDLLPYNVIAIGSQDRNITVWTTASPRPLFVAKHFFSQSVVDLTWSPDGYSLFACSLDGTIATFHFDVNEIGHKLTEAELYDLKKNRYGDTRGQQGSLAETPAQLLLEAASVKHAPLKKKISPIIPETQASLKQTPLKKMNPVTPETQSSKPSTDLVVTTQNNGNHAQGDKKTEDSATDESKKVEPARVSSPIKQREYTRPDGRKRIIPEAVGSTANQKKTRIASQSEVLEVSRKSLDGIGGISDCGAINGYFQKSTENSLSKESHGVTARATITESLVVEKVPESSGKEGTKNVEEIGRVACGGNLSIKVYDNRQGEDKIPFCLEAHSRERAVTDIIGTGNSQTIKETEILCTKGCEKERLWSDRISGKVTVLAGNFNFWAVGCEDGCLHVYTKCGRHAMPAMMLGSAAVFIDCDEIWRLLLVTKNGSLYVWDLFTKKCLLHDSLSSLIPTDQKLNPKATGTMKVISVKLSKCGSPLAVLVTRHAYLFDTSLMCWLRVADDSFSASNFGSSWNFGSGQSGELAALQVDVRKFVARKPGWGRVTDDGVQTRAHLETQMASAMALKSPNEYRQSLLSYIRFLTREADEPRLREVCESFLGPPMGMVESESSDTKPSAWEPSVLGADKHKLLREDVLPAMASNRKVQRLLNEFMDLLSEYEAETNVIKENHAFPAPQPLVDKMDSEPVSSKLDSDHSTKTTQTSLTAPAADAVDPDHSTKATHTSLIAPAVDAVDPTPQTDDRMDTTPQTTNQAPEDPVQLQTAPLVPSEEMDINPPNSDHMDIVEKADGDLPSPVQQNNEC